MSLLRSGLEWLGAHPMEFFAWVSAALVTWKGKPWLDAKLSDQRTQTVLKLARMAFYAIEEAGRVKALPEGLKKTILFADKLMELAIAAGLGELSTQEKALAQAHADGLHLASKVDPSNPSLAPAG